MSNFCLGLCRFCLSAWFGAASLFVTAGIAEIKSNNFDAITTNALVAARFPHYYRFGFSLVVLALVSSVLARKNPAWNEKRASLVSGLMLFVFTLMVVDYWTIFLPLLQMMNQPTLSEKFQEYHESSKLINMVGLTFVFIAAWIACWPIGKVKATESTDS